MPDSHPSDAELAAFAQGSGATDWAAVEAHLETCPDCCARLAAVPDTDPLLGRLRATGTVSLSASADVPAAFPGYDLLGELGRGGMGVVYRARQRRPNREVALKVLLHGLHADPQAVVRLRAEAEAVARLGHPNVVRVYEVGEHAGQPFLALEYLAGGTLAAAGPVTPRRAAELVAAVARGVAAAHAAGVVHRDVKPQNVLFDAAGVPKLTDFGLAKLVDDDRGLTRTGAAAGTPAYMAPEQADGRPVGPTADVYGLGAVLYELLAGRPPFAGPSVLDTLSQVRAAPPVSPRRLRPGVPRDLETVCLKCLEKEPGKRYPSAAALADDLGRYLAGRPVTARPVGTAEAAWRFARRRPELAALLVVGLLVAAVGFPAVSVLYLRAAAARTDADRQAADARAAEGRAEHSEAAARRQLAELYLERGLDLAAQGEVGPGLLWVREALATAPAEDDHFHRVGRVNLLDWSRHAFTPLRGHPIPGVRSVAWAPDGKTYALGDGAATVRVFDAATGRPVGPVIAAEEPVVCSLAFSPDGTRLATGCGYHLNFDPRVVRAARVFDVATGRKLGELANGPLVRTVAWSRDGRRLVTADADRAVRVWDAATFAQAGPPLTRPGWRPYSAAFTPDGGRVVVCSGEKNRAGGRLAVWEAGDPPRELAAVEFPRPPNWEGEATVAADGRTVAVIQPGGTEVYRLDPATGRLDPTPAVVRRGATAGVAADGVGLAVVTDGSRLVVARPGPAGLRVAATWHPRRDEGDVAISPDGTRVLTESGLWRLPPAGPVGRPADAPPAPPGEAAPFEHAAVDPAAARVLFGRGPTAGVAPGRLVEVATGRPLAPPPVPVGLSAFSPDGRRVAITRNGWGDGDFDPRLWEPLTGRVARLVGGTEPAAGGGVVPFNANNIYALTFSADGRTLFTGGLWGAVNPWDTADERPRPPSLSAGGLIRRSGLAAHPDGRRVAAGVDGAATGRVWDTATGRPTGRPTPGVRQVRYSPAGDALLGWTEAAARVWEPDLSAPRTPPFGQGMVIQLAEFSPDGRRVLTAGRDGLARVWDAATGRPAGREMRGPDRATAAAFSPDGSAVVVGYADGTARVWDAATGWPLGAPVAQPHPVLAVAWRPDGREFLTASTAGAVRRWPLPADGPEPDLLRLTGLRMADGQVVSPVPSDEWPPEADRPDPAAEAATHDAQARDAEEAGRWHAAGWHLDRLAALAPPDWLREARRAAVALALGDAPAATAAYDRAVGLGGGAGLADWLADRATAGTPTEKAWYRSRQAPSPAGR